MFPGITEIITAISGVLARIIPDPDKRMEAETEIQKALLASQSAIFDAMKSVMVADAQSEGWMTRNARPLTVFWCLGMMTWVVVSPIFGVQAATIKSIQAIPDTLWSLSAYGIGAYILGKSGVDIAKALKK